MNNNELFSLQPIETYTPPSLPTLDAGRPAQLKKLPKRWQKSAAVLACAGVMGLSMLTGCSDSERAATPVDEPYWSSGWSLEPTYYHFTHGGSGSAPFYVVYLTEEEALSVIREELERTGLRMGATPSDNTITVEDYWGDTRELSLGLYDAEKQIGVAFIPKINSYELSQGRFWRCEETSPDIVRELFATQLPDMRVGVFYSPGMHVDTYDISQAQRELRDQLRKQVQAFIEQLRKDGVFHAPPDLSEYMQDLDYRVSWGGSGSGPWYVVHLTEEETLGVIRTMLQDAGLNLDGEVPNYQVGVEDDFTRNVTNFGLSLFDAERRIGIAMGGGRVSGLFADQHNLTVGAFWLPGQSVEGIPCRWDDEQISDREKYARIDETKESAAPYLRQQLVEEVQTFIMHLRRNGIL